MPRNPAGTDYSVPHTFTQTNPDGSRRVISSDQVNQNFNDLGNEVVNSLPRDGRAPMTGPLRLVAGTEEAPGLTFAGDTDTGFVLLAAGEIGLVSGGVVVATVTASGISQPPHIDNDAFFYASTL